MPDCLGSRGWGLKKAGLMRTETSGEFSVLSRVTPRWIKAGLAVD